MIPSPLAAGLFNSTLASDYAWFHKAKHLLQACEILLDAYWKAKRDFNSLIEQGQTEFVSDSDTELCMRSWLHPEISLLAGLAVENFLKGLWVIKNPSGLSSTEKLPKQLLTHNVLRLADDLQIDLGEEEKLCLKHLSQMSEWQGKYLIPRNRSTNVQIHQEWVDPGYLVSKFKEDTDKPKFPDAFISLLNKIGTAVEKARSEAA